jgi:hypothetical protein
MRKHIVIAIAALVTPILAAIAIAGGASDEERAVREAVDLYFQGHATGNGEPWRKAFYPDAKLFWVKDGQITQRTSAEFIAGALGQPAPDEGKRKRRVLSVDISNDAAVAKVDLDYPGRHLVDYLSLLRVDGRWKIVNKIFTTMPQ